MSTIKFNNVMLVMEDPENQFKNDEDFKVTLRYDSLEGCFKVLVPETKKVENVADKPKPINLFTGLLTGIKGTITTKGNGKVNMDMPPAKMKAIGKTDMKKDLLKAFESVCEYIHNSQFTINN